MTTVRNVAIIALLAAAVFLLPGGGTATDVIFWIFGLLFLGSLAWFAGRLYREHRATIYSLGDRLRLLLYGALGVAVLTFTATSEMWDTGVGVLAWFVLMGGVAFALVTVWRQSRQY